MPRERLADLDESNEDERERKLKLQEKNRRAQQAFRWRQKSKIQELSEEVSELQARDGKYSMQVQELVQSKATLEAALLSQSAQLKRLSTEYALLKSRSVSNIFVPSTSLQFDPSEDILLKYPVTAANGSAEHILISSSDVKEGTGMERLTRLVKEEWLPHLEDASTEYDAALEKQQGNNCGSSRTKQARQEEVNKAISGVEARVQGIQRLYVECFVKMIRGTPVRARMATTDVIFNCHAAARTEDGRKLAEKVLESMAASPTELDLCCTLYEKYLCNMAMLRRQRENMVQQLEATYNLSDGEWLTNLSSQYATDKAYLCASATIETLHIWLRKETELFCELLSNVLLESLQPLTFMRCLTAAAPGSVDLLTLLDVVHVRSKPERDVLALVDAHTKSSMTPRTVMAEEANKAAMVHGHPMPCDFAPLAAPGALLPSPKAPSPANLVSAGGTTPGRSARKRIPPKAGTPDDAAGHEFWASEGTALPKMKARRTSHDCPGGTGGGTLPKLEHSQLLALPNGSQPTAVELALDVPASAAPPSTFSSPAPSRNLLPPDVASIAPAPGPAVLPPLANFPTSQSSLASSMQQQANAQRQLVEQQQVQVAGAGGRADISWLTTSLRAPHENDFSEFLNGLLGNVGPTQQTGRVSQIDIVRVRSVSQVGGEISLMHAQETVSNAGASLLNHVSRTEAPLTDKHRISLTAAVANLLPSCGNIAMNLNGTTNGSGVRGALMPDKGSPQLHTVNRRTAAELAKQYQEFMGEPI